MRLVPESRNYVGVRLVLVWGRCGPGVAVRTSQSARRTPEIVSRPRVSRPDTRATDLPGRSTGLAQRRFRHEVAG